MSDADVIVFPMVPHPRPDEPAMTRAEHDRRKLLDVAAFGVAERLAEGTRQAAVEQAAAELKAIGNNKGEADYDRHNLAVHAAEVAYLTATIEAAAKYGVIGHWKQTLANLPKPVTAQQWAEGKGKW
jgi:alkylhydroperoxidase family enzyme